MIENPAYNCKILNNNNISIILQWETTIIYPTLARDIKSVKSGWHQFYLPITKKQSIVNYWDIFQHIILWITILNHLNKCWYVDFRFIRMCRQSGGAKNKLSKKTKILTV